MYAVGVLLEIRDRDQLTRDLREAPHNIINYLEQVAPDWLQHAVRKIDFLVRPHPTDATRVILSTLVILGGHTGGTVVTQIMAPQIEVYPTNPESPVTAAKILLQCVFRGLNEQIAEAQQPGKPPSHGPERVEQLRRVLPGFQPDHVRADS